MSGGGSYANNPADRVAMNLNRAQSLLDEPETGFNFVPPTNTNLGVGLGGGNYGGMGSGMSGMPAGRLGTA